MKIRHWRIKAKGSHSYPSHKEVKGTKASPVSNYGIVLVTMPFFLYLNASVLSVLETFLHILQQMEH